MPLRYVSVVIKYQEESPPISLGDRVVITLAGQSLHVTLEGLYSILEYIPLSETVAASPVLDLVC